MTASETISVLDHALLNAAGISWQDTGYDASVNKPSAFSKKMARPFRNDFMILLLVVQGQMHLRINLRDVVVNSCELVMLLPQTIFELTGVSDDLYISHLLVDREFFGTSGFHANGKEAFEIFSASQHALKMAENECAVINSFLHILQYEAELTNASLLRKDIARYTFLALLFELSTLYRKYNTEMKVTASRKEDLTLRFLELLSAHFREERSVQYYADHLFVTAKYLSTAIKEVTIKSPGALIDEAVIAEAKILLTNPSSSIAEVAEALSFSDQSFFGKYFKKHSGYSPSDYRLQYWAA